MKIMIQESSIRPNRLSVESESEEYNPKLGQKKMIRKPKHKIDGKWLCKQEQIYLDFLKNNQLLFKDEFTRRSQRVFLQLSKIIKSRTINQCRSHHQKYEIKCQNNIAMIITQVQKKIIYGQKKKSKFAQLPSETKNQAQTGDSLKSSIQIQDFEKDKLFQSQNFYSVQICLDNLQQY